MNILVGLSGGVDSAVSAAILRDKGFKVSGAYIRTWMNEEESEIFGDCPWKTDIEDARKVAEHLGIDFEVINLIDQYREKVVEYLVKGYQSGTTPNPDIMCNRKMKFGVFLDYALRNSFDGIATGHYCQKVLNANGTCDLYEGLDKNKDQSYFLALLQQQQIQPAHFPVGHLLKPQVRELASQLRLPNAAKKDSQGICFLGKIDINAFLEQYIEEKPGEIIRVDGKVLGQHKGLHRYTLGQRKGIGIPSNADFEKYVVVSKDAVKNQLIVAFDHPDAPGLFTSEVTLVNLSWTNKTVTTKTQLLGKPRYRDSSQKLIFDPIDGNSAKIIFETPQRALASGQVLALYEGEKLLGGGFYL